MNKNLRPIATITLVTAMTIASTLFASSTNAFGGFEGFKPRPGMMSSEHRDALKNITIDVSKTDKGITINKTSTDPEALKKLHEMADRMIEEKSITRKVTQIDNGVEITMTSTLPQVIERLQKEPEIVKKIPKNDLVKVVKENLTNGVKITMTSDDPDQVKKIQNPSYQDSKVGKRGKGRHR